MKDSLELQARLKKLERLLLSRAPARRAEGASILNALAVQLETMPRPNVVEALLRALTALLDEGLVDPRQGELAEDVAQILRLCRDEVAKALPEQATVDPEDDDEPAVSYSLGPRASEIISFLRFKAGMAADCIHLFLKRYFGVNIPWSDLQKIILTLPPSIQPPQRHQSRARR